MTLNDLIRKAQALSMQLSSGDVPLVFEGEVVDDIVLEYKDEDEEGPCVRITFW